MHNNKDLTNKINLTSKINNYLKINLLMKMLNDVPEVKNIRIVIKYI